MIIKFDIPENWQDTKQIGKFLWLPLYFEHKIYWLEWVTIEYDAMPNTIFFDRDYHWAICDVIVLEK